MQRPAEPSSVALAHGLERGHGRGPARQRLRADSFVAILANDREALTVCVPSDSRALGINTKTGQGLPVSRDERGHDRCGFMQGGRAGGTDWFIQCRTREAVHRQ